MLMMKIRPLGSRTSVVVATAHLESPTDKTPPELRLAQLESCLDLLGQVADASRDADADEATDEVGADEHGMYRGSEDGDGVGELGGYRFRSISISSEAEDAAASAGGEVGGEGGGEGGGESGADAIFLGDMNVCSREQAAARRVMAGRYEQTANAVACRLQRSRQQCCRE